MILIVAVAAALWLVRPAVILLLLEGVGSHSHAPPDPGPIRPGENPDHHMRMFFRRHDVHADPFWPHYVRLLVGMPLARRLFVPPCAAGYG